MTTTPLSARATDAPAVLRATGLSRVFSGRAGKVPALTEASLAVAEGEFVVVRGPSGAGKTTLLNLLGGLDRPTSGTVHVGAKELSALREEEVLALRRTELSYIFQSFGLVPVLSAAENVEVPLRLLRTEASERARRVTHALELVGLGDHARQRPYELSGGQQQRVGIARALVTDPSILLADEPTGQLDSATAAMIMDLLGELTHQRGLAAVVATHDPLMVARADRVLEIHDGHLSEPAARGHARDPLQAAARPVAPVTTEDTAPVSAPAEEPQPETLTRAELRRRRQRP